MQTCPSDWLTLLWSPQQHIFCKGFLVKAKMLHSSKWGYFTVENEIQLQLESKSVRNISIIFFRNHMMTAVRHESEGMVLFEGKGRNSLSNRCLPSTSYMCNSTIWIFFCQNGIRQRWLSQVIVYHCVTSLTEETNPTNKPINVKLRKMCYLNKANNQVIVSTNTKLWWTEKNKKTCCSWDVVNHLLHLLTICNSEVKVNIAVFLIVTTLAVCSIMFEIQFYLVQA